MDLTDNEEVTTDGSGERWMSPGRGSSVTSRIRAMIPSLIPSHARVASVILDDPIQASHYSVTELARAATTSSSTVVRFAQELGYRGYQQLRTEIARDSLVLERRRLVGISEDRSPRNLLDHVAAASEEAIQDALTTVSIEKFEQAAQALVRAGHILCAGVGTSAPLAQDAAYRFSTLSLNATFTADIHTQHISATFLGSNDLCLLVSHTGATKETLLVADAALASGATAIAVTSHFQSPLSDRVPLSLVAGSRETWLRADAMASRLAHLVIIDALYLRAAALMGESAQAAYETVLETVNSHRTRPSERTTPNSFDSESIESE